MHVNYVVARSAEGWSVFEDGLPLVTVRAHRDALEMGCLLTLAIKAAGGKAGLFLRQEDGALAICDSDADLSRLPRPAGADRADMASV
jgi:hypothetical protein